MAFRKILIFLPYFWVRFGVSEMRRRFNFRPEAGFGGPGHGFEGDGDHIFLCSVEEMLHLS